MIKKETPVEAPIHDLIASRWSPRAFNSDFFIDKIRFYANKYELGCYPESPANEGCWVFFLDDWKKVLDNKKK